MIFPNRRRRVFDLMYYLNFLLVAFICGVGFILGAAVVLIILSSID